MCLDGELLPKLLRIVALIIKFYFKAIKTMHDSKCSVSLHSSEVHLMGNVLVYFLFCSIDLFS